MTTCTSEQAIKAVGYLGRAFGGYPPDDTERRALLRAFARFTPAEVRAAIDELVVVFPHRPSANAIAQHIRKHRPAVPDTRPSEPWPELTQPAVSRHVAECKSRIHQ